MTSDDTSHSSTDPSEPIDVEFAPAEEPKKKSSGKGPGWLALIIVGLMSAGLGASLAILASSLKSAPSSTDTAEITAQLSTLKTSVSDMEIQAKKLTRDAKERETRIDAKLSGIDEMSPEALARMTAQIETLSARIETKAPSGDSLVSLEARLQALETADADGGASPIEIARAVAALDERVTALATSLQAQQMADDSNLASLTALKTELDALRQNGLASASQAAEDAGRLATLVSNFDEKEAQLRTDAEAAKQASIAALALSGIEAAARRGKGFPANHAKLSAAMPNNASVQALSPLASYGAPVLSELQASFKPLKANTLAELDDKSADKLGWINRTFGDALSVRQTNPEADAIRLALEEAEMALGTGDLKKAVQHISNTGALNAPDWENWTQNANARITLEGALEDLRLNMIGVER